MHAEIQTIFLIPTAEDFHPAFERHFQVNPIFRVQFANDNLLWDIRKAFLWEYSAEHADLLGDKLIHYHDALQVLTHTQQTTISPINNESLLYLCHYIAKIHYQMGVQWMSIGDDLNDEFDLRTWFMNHSSPSHHQQAFIDLLASHLLRVPQLAISAFEHAAASYQPFKDTAVLLNEQDFYETSQRLHAFFAAFDAYSPWARLISIECNHFLCIQEEEQSEDASTLLLARIMERIERYNQGNSSRSSSSLAIADVATLLRPFNKKQDSFRPADAKKTGLKTAAASSSSSSSKKRKAVVIDNWLPMVSSRDQFNASTRQGSWMIPSFLKARQQIDLDIIYRSFSMYDKPLIITKPTGTGKTAEFSALTNSAWIHGIPTIIVVPTATLVEQTHNKLIEYKKYDGMSYEIEHIGMFCPTKKTVKVAPITIVTQMSYVCQAAIALKAFPTQEALQAYIADHPNAYLQKDVLFHPDFFSLLIVDEGHHIEGDKLFALMTRPGCERPKILFSASTLPGEYPRIDSSCQHLITQTLRDAIVSRELAPVQALTIDFSMYAEAKELTRSIRSRMMHKIGNGELDEESRSEIAALLCHNAGFSLTAISVLKQVMENVSTARKAMIFTDSIDHADCLATLLSLLFKEKISAYHTQAPNKQAILRDFSSHQSKIIVAVGALDEGFDDSNVNIILDFSIYKTRVRRMIQRLGRALRLREDESGAILISIKLLPKDLQLIPRDEILNHQTQSYLGMDEEDVLDATTLRLTLPASICMPTSTGEKLIAPQGASIVFPKQRRPIKLGSPPETEEERDESRRPIDTLGFFTTPSQSSAFGSATFTQQEEEISLVDGDDVYFTWLWESGPVS